MRPRFKKRPRRGVALPTVLFALIIVSVMTAAAVQTGVMAQRSGIAFRQSEVALFAAEAGLRYTTGNWPTASVNGLNPGDSLDLGWSTLPNRATYRVVITRVDNNNLKTYLMVSQGRGPGVNLLGGQRTVVRVVGNAPLFKWGIFTNSGISMSGNAGTDSFNSSDGPYNAAHPDSLGTVATNGSITASGNVNIKGSATAAGSISSGSYYTGTVTSHVTPLPNLATVNCPTSGFSPASEVSGGSYNASTGVLSGSGNATITLSGAQAFYFTSISLSGNAQLVVNTAGGHVDVYVAGQATISGNGASNTTGSAPMLNFSACGNPTSPAAWSFSGNAAATYTVYAPDRAVSMSGNGDLYGAIVAKTFTNSGNGKLHYDEALSNLGGTQLYVLAGSWTELTLY